MCGEKYRLALVLQLLHEVANFAPAHGIEAGHRFIKKNYLGVVKNGLRDSHSLQHSLGKFP